MASGAAAARGGRLFSGTGASLAVGAGSGEAALAAKFFAVLVCFLVDLSHCVTRRGQEMAVLSAAVGLRELVMDKCLGVTGMGLAKVAVGFPGLERQLSVKWCRDISDIGSELLAKVAVGCPGLERQLSVKWCDLRSIDVSYLKVAPEYH